MIKSKQIYIDGLKSILYSCPVIQFPEAHSMEHICPADLIPTTEARKLLGISTVKMAQLLKDNQIRHFPDPLDKRVKLVSESEVLSLKIGRKAA